MGLEWTDAVRIASDFFILTPGKCAVGPIAGAREIIAQEPAETHEAKGLFS
jgi:hypothetical protein